MMMYQKILDEITKQSCRIFGSALTGIYLHGSLAMGCFQPKKSDIDLIIVIQNDITEEQKMKFMKEIIELNKTGPGKGIELSIVKRAYCGKFLYPTPFELHFSNMHLPWFLQDPAGYIRNMKGTDKDLAAHFTIIKKYGIVVYGEQIAEVFGDVPKENYIDSIWSDVEGAQEEIFDNPVYIILNLCRVAAFLKDDLITSKKGGGEWALQNFAPEYRLLISDALNAYKSGDEMQADPKELSGFSEHMLMMIREMMSSVYR